MLLEPPRTRYDLQWTMLGIPTRVHPLFWLTAFFLGWDRDRTLAFMALWVACVFVSILVHEFGHALSARAFGARHLRVILWMMGGLAVSEGGLTRRQRILELLCGPGAGFVLCGAAWGLMQLPAFAHWNPYLQLTLVILWIINLSWGLLNLLPVYPLDGGQIVRELFLAKRPLDGALRAHTFSIFAAVVAAIGFAAWDISQGARVDIWVVFIFLYLAYLNWQLRRVQQQLGPGGAEHLERRDSWERDPDWWKPER